MNERLYTCAFEYIKNENLNYIYKYLISSNQQKNDIKDLLNLDFGNNVNLSWINNGIENESLRAQGIENESNEYKLRIYGIVSSFKDAGDILADNCFGSLADEYFYPIMTCYTQYIELILKTYMNRNGINHNIKSHNIINLFNQAKGKLLIKYGKEKTYLLDVIITELFDFGDPSLNKEGIINYRYLYKDGDFRLKTNTYKLNVPIIKMLMDIIDYILHGEYNLPTTYSDDDLIKWEKDRGL